MCTFEFWLSKLINYEKPCYYYMVRLIYGWHIHFANGPLLPDTWNCGLRTPLECPERFPHHRLQRKPLVSYPSMHYVPWCMSGSLTRFGGENIPGIPGACTTPNFMDLARSPWNGTRQPSLKRQVFISSTGKLCFNSNWDMLWHRCICVKLLFDIINLGYIPFIIRNITGWCFANTSVSHHISRLLTQIHLYIEYDIYKIYGFFYGSAYVYRGMHVIWWYFCLIANIHLGATKYLNWACKGIHFHRKLRHKNVFCIKHIKTCKAHNVPYWYLPPSSRFNELKRRVYTDFALLIYLPFHLWTDLWALRLTVSVTIPGGSIANVSPCPFDHLSACS